MRSSNHAAQVAQVAQDAPQDLPARRAAIRARIAQADEAIVQWRRWQANQSLPVAQRLPITRPPLNLADCLELRQLLEEELTELDGRT